MVNQMKNTLKKSNVKTAKKSVQSEKSTIETAPLDTPIETAVESKPVKIRIPARHNNRSTFGNRLRHYAPLFVDRDGNLRLVMPDKRGTQKNVGYSAFTCNRATDKQMLESKIIDLINADSAVIVENCADPIHNGKYTLADYIHNPATVSNATKLYPYHDNLYIWIALKSGWQ